MTRIESVAFAIIVSLAFVAACLALVASIVLLIDVLADFDAFIVERFCAG